MKKRTWLLIGALIILTAGIFLYFARHQETPIIEESDPAGEYSVQIVMTGDPGFPFGSVTCRFDLKQDSKTIASQEEAFANDGKIPSEEQFEIRWQSDSAEVTCYPEEEDAFTVTLQK